jgi:hypothetical protein
MPNDSGTVDDGDRSHGSKRRTSGHERRQPNGVVRFRTADALTVESELAERCIGGGERLPKISRQHDREIGGAPISREKRLPLLRAQIQRANGGECRKRQCRGEAHRQLEAAA